MNCENYKVRFLETMKLQEDELDIVPGDVSDGVFFVEINGTRYGYEPSAPELTVDDLARKFNGIMKHSKGRALAWLKRNSELVFGSERKRMQFPLSLAMESENREKALCLIEGKTDGLGQYDVYVRSYVSGMPSSARQPSQPPVDFEFYGTFSGSSESDVKSSVFSGNLRTNVIFTPWGKSRNLKLSDVWVTKSGQ